ncbi:hypothetical protein [Halobacillus massiliensis]|uniref:hypothetical protein n=1 Tax=Halobacillus massiliensis TaxID=1926286 RepID=UPI0015C49697|nr:hypothetical protein [Halobacillus massiliensis]
MTDHKNQRYQHDNRSPEQKIKEEDPNRDVDPQREVEDNNRSNNKSEKNPDDFDS